MQGTISQPTQLCDDFLQQSTEYHGCSRGGRCISAVFLEKAMLTSQKSIVLAIAVVFCYALLWIIYTSNTLLLANMCLQDPHLSTNGKHVMDSKTISFHLHPNKFVNELTDCFNDSDCWIYCYHFGKGIAGMEQWMAQMFPPRFLTFFGVIMMEHF